MPFSSVFPLFFNERKNCVTKRLQPCSQIYTHEHTACQWSWETVCSLCSWNMHNVACKWKVRPIRIHPYFQQQILYPRETSQSWEGRKAPTHSWQFFSNHFGTFFRCKWYKWYIFKTLQNSKLITLVILCSEPLILHSLCFHTWVIHANQSVPWNTRNTFILLTNKSDNDN